MNIIFTKHSLDVLYERKITKEEVFHAIRYPTATLKKYGVYYIRGMLQRGILELVCEKTEKDIKIITLYWL